MKQLKQLPVKGRLWHLQHQAHGKGVLFANGLQRFEAPFFPPSLRVACVYHALCD